jgi:hypothetical protein
MHKPRADRTLDCYMVHWVIWGFIQHPGVDYNETFSPVLKSATVHTVLSTAVSRIWPIQQLDMKNAFLHDTLSKTVFCCQPTGFHRPCSP